MSRLICVGDIMQDVSAVIAGPIYWGSDTVATVRMQGGGSPANVAAWAAFTNFPTLMVGRVGNDLAGEAMIKELQSVGVETHVTRDPVHHTGMVVLLVDEKGERTMFPDPGANRFLNYQDFPALQPKDVLFVSGYAFLYPETRAAVVQYIEEAKKMGIPVGIDPGSAGYISTGNHDGAIDTMLSVADLIIANEDEARVLTGKSDNWDACEDLAARGMTAVVKLGARGAIAIQDGKRYERPANEVPVIVDTTGAGDAFAGGFLTAFAVGASMEECLHAGVNTASTCVGRIGARP